MTLVQHRPIQTALPESDGIDSHIGHTPLLPLRRLAPAINLPPSVRIYTKAEWFNPGGSVKDRPALHIIRTALESGRLTPGKRLLDSTSGNMGIAYATLGAALDIPVTLTMPANASPERITILKALGVELILTDPLEGSDGAMVEADRIATESPDLYFYANQYNNPANWKAHYDSTGPEIWEDTHGQVTHFVAGLGTSGTLTGVGKYLREMNPSIQIVAGQPDAAFHGLEGLKHMQTAIKPGIYDPDFPDRTIEVTTEDAYDMVGKLARDEGMFVGISSGAAAVAAIQVASELEAGMVVTIFPDSGYKYLSDTNLWDGDENGRNS